MKTFLNKANRWGLTCAAVLFWASVGFSGVAGASEQESKFLALDDEYAIVQLESGSFRIDRVLLKGIRERLAPGIWINYVIDHENKKFPDGIIVSVKFLDAPTQGCAGACL